MQVAKARRHRHRTEEFFLMVEMHKPLRCMRFERKGNVLREYHTPHTFAERMRCHRSLMRGLPEIETVSITY